MRDLVKVIDQLIKVIPSKEVQLIGMLKDAKGSIRYAAPEMMTMWWNEVYGIIVRELTGREHEEFVQRVMEIFSGQS
mgnify:CR=1 FL=1